MAHQKCKGKTFHFLSSHFISFYTPTYDADDRIRCRCTDYCYWIHKRIELWCASCVYHFDIFTVNFVLWCKQNGDNKLDIAIVWFCSFSFLVYCTWFFMWFPTVTVGCTVFHIFFLFFCHGCILTLAHAEQIPKGYWLER